jgi:hypothetical protein
MRAKTEVSAPESFEQSLPFFARFLEGQDTPEVCRQTLKYPSDRDEDDYRLEYMSGNDAT